MREDNHNATETSERTSITTRFIIAWVNFCTSVVTLQSNEKSFQAWFASHLIQEFGLARVYREVHLDKKQIKECFADRGGLKAVFPRLYSSLRMDGNELFPDVCVSKVPNLDTRHTPTRSPDLQRFNQIITKLDVVTELKVAMSKKGAAGTRYNYVYSDILKLGALMNAALSDGSMPLSFACVLENLPKPQPKDFVKGKYVQHLLEDSRTWPIGWKKPTVMVTALIKVDPEAEAEWVCYLIDGASDWERQKVVARFPIQFALQPEESLPLLVSQKQELPGFSPSKPSSAPMSEQKLLAESSGRCRELYSGLRDLAQKEPFRGSGFTGSGYTLRYGDGRTQKRLLLLCPNYLKMGFGPGYPKGFLSWETDRDFWLRVATVPAFKGIMDKKRPETRLTDETWTHDNVQDFLSALDLLRDR